MTTHLVTPTVTPTQARLHREHLERRARMTPAPVTATVIVDAARLEPPPPPRASPVVPALPLPPSAHRCGPLTVLDCTVAAAAVWVLPPGAVTGRSQSHRIAEARHAAVRLARELVPGASLPVIGRALGRDHTTALSSLRRAECLLRTSPRFEKMLGEARGRLLGRAAGGECVDKSQHGGSS